MPASPEMTLTLAVAGLLALAMITLAGLKGFKLWIDLERARLSVDRPANPPSLTGNRIELADLKERLRKLEAIAAGVEL